MNNTNLRIIEELKTSVRQENRHLAQTLRLLAEVAERRIHLAQGYSSLYHFCINELGLSEGSVYRRTQVVAKIRKHPTLLQMIEDSSINLSVAALLCPHLDQQSDVSTFLKKFLGKTKRAAEELLIDKAAPRPSPKDDVRRLPDRPVSPAMPEARRNDAATEAKNPSPKPHSHTPKGDVTGPEVIREKCYQFNFAAGERLKGKLERLQDLLSHKYPAGRLEHIIEEAVDHFILAKTPKEKRATSPKPSRSRHIPIKWREQTYLRAGHRCEFVGHNGLRCSATRLLQVDHRKPLSVGGLTELGNLQVLCAAHNLHKAKCDHGTVFIQRKIGGKG